MDNPDRVRLLPRSSALPNRQWRIFDQEQWNPDRFAADHSAARAPGDGSGWWYIGDLLCGRRLLFISTS